MKKKVLLGFVAGGLLVLLCTLSSYAVAPEVTKLEITGGAGDSAAPASHYLIMPCATDGIGTGAGVAIIIPPTVSDSDGGDTFSIGGAVSVNQGSSEMAGISTGSCFGALLMDVLDATEGDGNITAIESNKIVNHTDEFLNATTGPFNVNNISTNLAVGTELQVTVDLKGHKPHFVGVLGSNTTVTYDATANGNDGELVITAKTIDTTSENGDSLTSVFAFCVNSDESLFGTTAMRLIGQTNIWVGDFNLFMPNSDDYTAQGSSDPAGEWGASDAICGFTAWGLTGTTREASIFIPEDSISTIFGSGVTSAMLTGLVNNSMVSTTITPDVTNFGVNGTTFVFDYTFASGKDAGVGVASAGSGGIDHHYSWYDCAIATAAYTREDGRPFASLTKTTDDFIPRPSSLVSHPSSLVPQLKILRSFRDERLVTHSLGRAFVDLYYQTSPPVADFIRDKESLKAIVRTGLKPLVWVAEKTTD